MNYIATFYTHAAALMTNRTLRKKDVSSRLGPVPRVLSSSCGTCVMYEADEPYLQDLDRDMDAVYEKTDQGYKQLLRNE